MVCVVRAVSITPLTMLFGIYSAKYPRNGLDPGCVRLYSDEGVGMDSDLAFGAADPGVHGPKGLLNTPE